MPELITVIDTYGDEVIVSKADYDNPKKTMLPMYTRTGKRFTDWYAQMNWFGKPTVILRGNIVCLLKDRLTAEDQATEDFITATAEHLFGPDIEPLNVCTSCRVDDDGNCIVLCPIHATAAEMLDSCKQVLAYLEEPDPPIGTCAEIMAAAIRKTEGGN